MLRIRALEAGLDRRGFHCGEPALDRYFREQVTQDIKRLITNCFVAIEDDAIAGFYTLSSASIAMTDLPESLTKRLPRYPALPAIRIGRLAVDRKFQGQGIGSVLLSDAIQRSLRAEAAGFTVLVDAKDERAATFYRHNGFTDLPSRPSTLYLPLATVKKIS
jgi:GNAT superfamily N-acetyltransferase